MHERIYSALSYSIEFQTKQTQLCFFEISEHEA